MFQFEISAEKLQVQRLYFEKFWKDIENNQVILERYEYNQVILERY